jgi:hypothetical protein
LLAGTPGAGGVASRRTANAPAATNHLASPLLRDKLVCSHEGKTPVANASVLRIRGDPLDYRLDQQSGLAVETQHFLAFSYRRAILRARAFGHHKIDLLPLELHSRHKTRRKNI